MKVQQIQNNNIDLKNKPQFKGVDGFLRYLATNQAVGANGVDLAFMVIPRTGTDLINRGPAAGLETGRREASGTVNHTLIGVYGGIAGGIIAAISGINSKYNANAITNTIEPITKSIIGSIIFVIVSIIPSRVLSKKFTPF